MFKIAFPWALLLIPLPLFLRYVLPPTKIKLPTALKVPFFAAMKNIVGQENHSFKAHSSLLIPGLIWLLLIIALAGPRWVGAPKSVERDGHNLMMALDLSGSMEIPDMMLNGQPTSRLNVVKSAAKNFVRDRSGDKIGLIFFGSRAYLQTPLTYDRHTVLTRLEDATVGLAGKTTSIGDAVGLAVKRLDKVPPKGRVIILLTDGANNSGIIEPLKAAELAKNETIKIYTIGLGSAADPRALTNGFLMQNASADLDEDTLQKMATLTGGRYFRATDTETLRSIYKTINELETVKHEEANIRPQIEYYPWFVGLALVLCLSWVAKKIDFFNRKRSLALNIESFKS